MEQHKLIWQTLEYHHFEKTADWYWAVWIIAIAISVGAFIFNNLLFGLLIILCAITLTLHARKHPPLHECEINPRGIRMAKTLYPYATIESFWVEVPEHEHGHHFAKIFLKSHKFFMPLIEIPLTDIDPELVRHTLRQYLPEVYHHEPLGHKILELLGF